MRITLNIEGKDVQFTADSVRVNYTEFSHESFNSIIAAYKAFGLYKETTLQLEQEIRLRVGAALAEVPPTEEPTV